MEEFKLEPEEKLLKASPCVICLGLVQDHFIKEVFIDEVVAILAYKFNLF